MIAIEQKLSGKLEESLDRFAKTVQEKVLLSGVAAMARVVYDEVKLNTSGARAGGKPLDPPGVKTGTLNSAVYRTYSSERSSDEVKVYKVSVNKSKAPHWFLVEYGTSRAPAHPYIRPAFDKIPQAVQAGQARMTQQLSALDTIEVGT